MLPSLDAMEYERIKRDLENSYDEEYELALEDRVERSGSTGGNGRIDAVNARAERRTYFRELFGLQNGLVKLQDWVVATSHRLVIVFEGRDAAGKGGMIKRITQRLNCIHRLLSQVPYKEIEHELILLPERVRHDNYARRPLPEEICVPQLY